MLMAIKGRFLACVMVVGAVTAAASQVSVADVWEEPSFGELIERAAKIARVRIQSRRAVEVDIGGMRTLCGYVYQAEVVETFKGDGRHFSFFNPEPADFRGTDTDYLVVVLERTAGEESWVRSRVHAPTGESATVGDLINCRLNASSLYVLSSPQSMIPFAMQHGSDGEELLQVNRYSVFWDTALVTRECPIAEERCGLLDWREARDQIRLKLELLR